MMYRILFGKQHLLGMKPNKPKFRTENSNNQKNSRVALLQLPQKGKWNFDLLTP